MRSVVEIDTYNTIHSFIEAWDWYCQSANSGDVFDIVHVIDRFLIPFSGMGTRGHACVLRSQILYCRFSRGSGHLVLCAQKFFSSCCRSCFICESAVTEFSLDENITIKDRAFCTPYCSRTQTYHSELGQQLCAVAEDIQEATFLFQSLSLTMQQFNEVAFRGTFASQDIHEYYRVIQDYLLLK